MHDRNGTPLKNGDVVLIPARITELFSGEDFCNVQLETIVGRRPDGHKETIVANTAAIVLHERD